VGEKRKVLFLMCRKKSEVAEWSVTYGPKIALRAKMYGKEL